MVTDEQLKNPKPEWGADAPDSKEGYWYRCMFDEQFPAQCAPTVMRWKPTWSNQTDPSGRLAFFEIKVTCVCTRGTNSAVKIGPLTFMLPNMTRNSSQNKFISHSTHS